MRRPTDRRARLLAFNAPWSDARAEYRGSFGHAALDLAWLTTDALEEIAGRIVRTGAADVDRPAPIPFAARPSRSTEPFPINLTWRTRMDPERHPFVPTRRRLGALLAAGATLAHPAMAAIGKAGEVDPHPQWFREGDEIAAKVNAGEYGSEAEADVLLDRLSELDRLAIATPPTTPAGAAACLEWVRREYLEFKIMDSEHDGGDRLVLGLLGHVLKIMSGSQPA